MSLGQLLLLSWWAGTVGIGFPGFSEVSVCVCARALQWQQRDGKLSLGSERVVTEWGLSSDLEEVSGAAPCDSFADAGIDGKV